MECLFCNLANAKMCLVDFTDANLHFGQQTTLFTLTLRDSSGNVCIGKNEIDVDLLPRQDHIKVYYYSNKA